MMKPTQDFMPLYFMRRSAVPGSDQVILDLNLAQINSKVAVSKVSPKGKILDTKVREGFQEGQLVFDAKALPSGAYMLWIRTEEGNVMAKVVLR